MTDTEHTLILDEPRKLGEPITDEAEQALMAQEYKLLLNKLLSACGGASVPVAVAAAVSAAFCIAVEGASSVDEARNYLRSCWHDAEAKLEQALEMKERMRNVSNDAGEQNQSADQGVAQET